jgi:dynein heavy chain 2
MIIFNCINVCVIFSGAKVKGEDVLVTWDNPEELEIYIRKLQTSAERLTTMNRKLRKSHFDISEKVLVLYF